MRIRVHPALCEGHGVCCRFAPSVYQLDEEGYLDLHLVDVPSELEAAAVLGAEACPARAITIERDRSHRLPLVPVPAAPSKGNP